MTEHTPGRLHVHGEQIDVRHEVDGEVVNHSVIAQAFCHRPRYREDAAHLALCWNCHDALVEACKQTKDDLATLVGWYAGDLCNAEHAAESKRRIAEHGMLHFLASASERMLTALALAKPAAKPEETQPCQE